MIDGPEREDLLWRADENFRESFRMLARGAVEGTVYEEGSRCLICAGVKVPLFNPAFAPPDTDMAVFAAEARAFYGRRGLPWALVVPEHAPPAPPGRIRGVDLMESQTMPVMTHGAWIEDGWPAARPRFEVRVADTPAAVADHRGILALCFGIPDDVSRLVMPGPPATPLLDLYVVYEAGRPVGTGALSEAAGLGGIFNIATHPERRREGIGLAVMRRLLDDARARGLETVVLQSSPAGVPLYRRLGFARLSTYTVYVDLDNA